MSRNNIEFVVYDYETGGTDPALDRIAQFAGVRTNMDLEVIAEPDMFYCAFADDYLPQPGAIFTTGITPQLTQEKGFCEAEFAKKISRLFEVPGTCTMGYNTIKFDDEFTRNIFYRNFYDPYAYSWQNGNSRWDIIDLVRACYALRPEGIVWPVNEDGRVSMRLELLTPANGIAHESSHDALSDVFGTVGLAKLIKDKHPRLYDYAFESRNKKYVKKIIEDNWRKPLIHINGIYGAANSYLSIIAPIAKHPTNANAYIAVDLTKDLTPLLTLSAEELNTQLYTPKADRGDKSPIPLTLIHINKSPIVAVTTTLREVDIQRLDVDLEACQTRLNQLTQFSKLTETVVAVYATKKEYKATGNVDTMLYDDFFSSGDKFAFGTITTTASDELKNLQLTVKDARFDELFFRYRARNFHNTLSEEERVRWKLHCRNAIEPNLAEYLSELNRLVIESEGDEDRLELIEKMRQHAVALADKYV